MTDKPKTPHRRDLFRAVLSLKNIEEVERFFTDLCTPAELLAMADRWRVAKLLDQEVPYREIYDRTGVSTATVTRVARALTYGESGYRTAITRIKKERTSDHSERN
jgi:TrpR-related protein YerC/YecD